MCQLDWARVCSDIWLNNMSGCICESLSRRNWIKRCTPPNTQMWVDIIQSTEGLKRTVRWRKVKFSLLLDWFVLYLTKLRQWSHLAFGILNFKGRFSGLQTGTEIYTMSFLPLSQAYKPHHQLSWFSSLRRKIMGLLSLHNHMTYVILYIYI